MSDKVEYTFVIGIIDHTGAIHYRKIASGNSDGDVHAKFWPNVTHKRWRFLIREWDLKKSTLDKESMNEEEYSAVMTLLRKILTPPIWVLEGEAWEAAGRPRGEAYEKFYKQWEKKKKKILKARGLDK